MFTRKLTLYPASWLCSLQLVCVPPLFRLLENFDSKPARKLLCVPPRIQTLERNRTPNLASCSVFFHELNRRKEIESTICLEHFLVKSTATDAVTRQEGMSVPGSPTNTKTTNSQSNEAIKVSDSQFPDNSNLNQDAFFF